MVRAPPLSRRTLSAPAAEGRLDYRTKFLNTGAARCAACAAAPIVPARLRRHHDLAEKDGGMASTAGQEPRTPSLTDTPSRTDTARAILARRRRNLLLPILLLVAVSLVAVSALLYWSAESINRSDVRAQDDLVRSVVQVRKEALRQLVTDYAWWDAVAHLGSNFEERWAREDLPGYLQRAFNISAGWVVASDGTVRFSFEDGQPLPPEAAPALPPGGAALIAAARAGGSFEAVPLPGFVLYDQDLALAGASLVAPLPNAGNAAGGQGNVLMFIQPLDLTLFASAGVAKHMVDLHFLRGEVPSGYVGCELKGLDGAVIGNIVWRGQRLGDHMLWSVAPLLLVALLAVCVLLFLAIKRVETVVSREGRLSISLYQEKQRRSQKSNFVSMVSHELRTPLQAIGTAADMLERFGDQMSEAERREEARTIRSAVATLARLVDDVLVMGRAEAAAAAGGGGEPMDLARLCRAIWREVSVALRTKQQMVLHDGIGTPLYGLSDAAMHTILSNLMQNAIKYSRGAGDIEVRLGRDGCDYIVAVTDHGPGVPPEEREAIFEPYWRSREAEGIAGTGLGLPVARSAARSLGGELSVEAPETGKGARFVLRWPSPA
jgi:signal transduction histidine kinase